MSFPLQNYKLLDVFFVSFSKFSMQLAPLLSQQGCKLAIKIWQDKPGHRNSQILAPQELMYGKRTQNFLLPLTPKG